MSYQPTYYQTTTLPLAVPTSKAQHETYYPPQKYGYSVSPPEVAESTSSGPSYAYASATSNSSYAGSTSGDYDSASSSANGVDMQEYMQDRFQGAFDPLPLDRTLAVQAQT